MSAELITAIAAILIALTTTGGAVYVARKQDRLGVGAPQQKLNSTLSDLNEAFESKIKVLEERQTAQQGKIDALTAKLNDALSERLRLLQENNDLRFLNQNQATRIQVLEAQVAELQTAAGIKTTKVART